MSRSSQNFPSWVPGKLNRARKREAEAEMRIPASPAHVWRVVSDVTRVAEWWPRALGGTVLGDSGLADTAQEGEMVEREDVGREQQVRLQWGRREGVVTQRVSQWEPGARYGWIVIGESVDGKELTPLTHTSVTIELHRDGPQTRVVIFGAFEPHGPKGTLALRQVVKLARSTYRKALKMLDAVFTAPQ